MPRLRLAPKDATAGRRNHGGESVRLAGPTCPTACPADCPMAQRESFIRESRGQMPSLLSARGLAGIGQASLKAWG